MRSLCIEWRLKKQRLIKHLKFVKYIYKRILNYKSVKYKYIIN